MTERKLATVRKITALRDIAGADKIELAIVDGWQVVIKKGSHEVGELIIYLEIDSWVPHTLAPFLTKNGHYPKVYQGVEGQRLKTAKLRGERSQGLILPLEQAMELFDGSKHDDGEELCEVFFEGADVTDILGILKWEQEIPACLAGISRGSFPAAIPKTDQERLQNLTNKFEEYKTEHTWFVSEKMHGSSMTCYLDADNVFHVCSRNVNLKEVEGNTFWEVAHKDNIEVMMREFNMQGMAIQGELCGPGINGNQYKLTEPQFFMFGAVHAKEGHFAPYLARAIAAALEVKFVPVINSNFKFDELETVESLLQVADGPSVVLGTLGTVIREGLVYCSNQDRNVSFKTVSDAWLLGGGEDA